MPLPNSLKIAFSRTARVEVLASMSITGINASKSLCVRFSQFALASGRSSSLASAASRALPRVAQPGQLFLGRLQLGPAGVVDAAAVLLARLRDEKTDRHAGLDAEQVVPAAAELGVGGHVAAQVDQADLGKLGRHRLAKTAKVRLSMKLRLVTKANPPSACSRSLAQRKKGAYRSWSLAFCAVLSAM